MHDRAEFRALGRRVYAAPGQATLHAKRLAAALPLEGTEPFQGALADAFRGCLPGQRLSVADRQPLPQCNRRIARFRDRFHNESQTQ